MNDDQNGILAAFFVLGMIFLIGGIVYSLTSLVNGACLAFIGVFLICFQIFLAEKYMKVDEPAKMRILVYGRGAGKTTECLNTLRLHPDAVMFVANENMKCYLPKDLQPRIINIRSRAWRGRREKYAIIDEPDLMKDEELEYVAAAFKIILVAAGIERSYDNPTTWLRRMIQVYGYEHKVAPMLPDHCSNYQYHTEYLAIFKGVKK